MLRTPWIIGIDRNMSRLWQIVCTKYDLMHLLVFLCEMYDWLFGGGWQDGLSPNRLETTSCRTEERDDDGGGGGGGAGGGGGGGGGGGVGGDDK